MVGSRSYSVSSNGSASSSGGSGNTSGIYSEYSAAGGSEKKCRVTAIKAPKLVYGQRVAVGGGGEALGGGGGAVVSQLQPPQQRVRPRRIMCRCCLSEQLQPKTRQSPVDSCSDEETPLLEFVPLDTLAMVDLREDKFTTSTTAGNGRNNDSSYKATSAARTLSIKGNKLNGTPTTTASTTTAMSNGCSSVGSIYDSGSGAGNTTLLDCLNACARIGASLADIELPQHICLDCCHTLEMCCEFIRCVRNADKILRRRCALPAKRTRQQQQLLQQLPQQRQSAGMSVVGSGDLYAEEGPASKRRRRREEKIQQLSAGRPRVSVKGLGYNTPKSISLPKSVAATAAVTAAVTTTSTERDELLDISVEESNYVRSFDSGIEIDEDLSSVKSSDCSANEQPIRCHLAKYEGYTYVVAETLSHDLERFHRSGRTRAASSGGVTALATYKCGFCIFECSVRQELNKHLQIHLGPPQHSCRKCNFLGHFKFLLAQHVRNVHHCALEAIGTGQEVCQKNIPKGCQQAGAAAADGPIYHCHLCGECFINYDALQQHRKSHKVFCKCTMCAFKSSTRENVLEHMAKEHKVLVERRLIVKYIPLQRINAEHLNEFGVNKTTEPTESKLLPKDNKYRKHLCQFCGKCFDRRFHLLKHEYGVHRLEIEQTNGADATTRAKLPCFGSGGMSTKHTKLKYLRQRNAVQAARQQRCIEDLALLDDQQPGQDITSKFQCEICSAVFMFNFELKYHLRTHNISTHTQTAGGKGAADKPTDTPTPMLLSAKCKQPLTAVIATQQAQQIDVENKDKDEGNALGEIEGKGGGDSDNEADRERGTEAEHDTWKLTNGYSNNMDATLSGLPVGVDLDLMALVAPQVSPLDSLDASTTSSNNSFDINYDDQLYLNDFDLGLLDCSGELGGF